MTRLSIKFVAIGTFLSFSLSAMYRPTFRPSPLANHLGKRVLTISKAHELGAVRKNFCNNVGSSENDLEVLRRKQVQTTVDAVIAKQKYELEALKIYNQLIETRKTQLVSTLIALPTFSSTLFLADKATECIVQGPIYLVPGVLAFCIASGGAYVTSALIALGCHFRKKKLLAQFNNAIEDGAVSEVLYQEKLKAYGEQIHQLESNSQ